MSTIMVDIDDTVYSFGDLARDQLAVLGVERNDPKIIRGAYCPWGEWRAPSDVVDLDIWLEVIDRCHQPKMILQQTPFPEAVRTLWELHESGGHNLLYVSNRNPEAHDATHQWLADWDFPCDENLLCTTADKLPLISHCQYIIDDRPKTLVQFIHDFHWTHKYGSNGPQRLGFGLWRPYNAALTDVPRIQLAPSWGLLRQYMAEKGVLSDQRDRAVA